MKRLILHIGQHKTGSKALQSFASHNRALLAQRGLLYPQGHPPEEAILAYRISHFKLYQLLCQALQQSSRAPLDQWLQALAAQPQATVLLSAEDVFEMVTAHQLDFSLERVEKAARLLQQAAVSWGFQPEVVVYLRRQEESLASHYSQFIRGGGQPQMSFDSYRQAIHWRLDSRPILEAWARVFGPAAFQVRLYPRGRIVEDFFASILDSQLLQGCRPAIPSLETVNPSSDRDTLELIRLSHRLGWTGLRFPWVASAPRGAPPASIQSWLGPAELQAFLDVFRPINQEIAQTYRLGGFQEEPTLQRCWQGYGGLRVSTVVKRLVCLLGYLLRSRRKS